MTARSLAFSVFRHAVLLAGAAIMLGPFVWMLSTSLKPPNEIFGDTLTLLPQVWAADRNYGAAFSQVPLARYLLNGVIVCGLIFSSQVLIALPCAYALAKLRFRGRQLLFALVIVGLMIPGQAPVIPLYLLMWQAGLLDTYAALVIPHVCSVFGIFLMRQFFRTVPDELIDAARLDGLGEFAIVWRIMAPTAVPALLSFGIFSLVWNWNDYLWPLIVIRTRDLATPPLGVVFFRSEEAGSDWGPLMAGTVVITAPLVVAFLLAQRRFIEGITLTGVKG